MMMDQTLWLGYHMYLYHKVDYVVFELWRHMFFGLSVKKDNKFGYQSG